MIDDSERREVARRLREYASFDCEDEGEEECLVDCADWGERVLNLLGCGDTEGECYAALADLIEPDTTSDTTNPDADTTKCDRDALLALADEFESGARDARAHKWNEPANAAMAIALADEYEANARRIREACGEVDG